jgi:hypothetical protein
MAQADIDNITRGVIPLSTLFTDPFLRDAFRRAEDGDSMTFAVPPTRPRMLGGGAAEAVREFEFA